MSISFTHDGISERDAVFGFVQTKMLPLRNNQEHHVYQKCESCSCPLAQMSNGEFACPICNFSGEFQTNSILYESNNHINRCLCLIFDISLSFDYVLQHLKLISDHMQENERIILISVSNQYNIIYEYNKVMMFDVFEDISSFARNNKYEMSKNTIDEVIIPSLFSVFFSNERLVEFNSLLSIQFLLLQCINTSFVAFCFINRDVSPVSIEKATIIGKKIESKNSIIHFGAVKHFKRLTAIARYCFGCVFGIYAFNSLTIGQLFNISKIRKMKIIMPRFMEARKVTSCDGVVRVSKSITKLLLNNYLGLSCQIITDHSRIPQNQNKAHIVEVVDSEEGRIITCHTVSILNKERSSIPSEALIGLLLKQAASNILTKAWNGEGIDQLIKSNILENTSLRTVKIINKIGDYEEHDVLRLFYILNTCSCDFDTHEINADNSVVFIVSPIIYIYTTETTSTLLDKYIKSEYPHLILTFDSTERINDAIKVYKTNI